MKSCMENLDTTQPSKAVTAKDVHIFHMFTSKALYLCTHTEPLGTAEEARREVGRLLAIRSDFDLPVNLGVEGGVAKLGFETELHRDCFMKAAYGDAFPLYEDHQYREPFRGIPSSLAVLLGERALSIASFNRFDSAVVVDLENQEVVVNLGSAEDMKQFLQDYNRFTYTM